MDGALNDAELNEFQVFFLFHLNFLSISAFCLYRHTDMLNDGKQVKCFHTHLQPAEIVGVKRVVQEREQNGVNDFGLTLAGFLVLHTLFIEKGRPETAWAVLREFGYNDDLELRHDFLPIPTKRAPDQVSLIYIIFI